MEHAELFRLTATALVNAVDGDLDAAATAICEVGANSGDDQFDVYAMCCAFAEAARQALERIHGDRAPNLARGGFWTARHVGKDADDAADLFAVRFIVAFANDDESTTLALWRAVLLADDNTDYVRAVAAMLGVAACLVRKANGL